MIVCDLCRVPPELTRSRALYPMIVVGPKGRQYEHSICDECVPLFNVSRWTSTRKVLAKLRGF